MRRIEFYGHESKGVVAAMIRWRIISSINHISIGAGSSIFESTALANGVTVSKKKRADIIMTEQLVVTDDEYVKILKYLNESVGVEYDFSAFSSFLLNKTRQNDSKMFCNEFAAGILKIIGVSYKISENLSSPKDFMYLIRGINEGIERKELLK
tara:strand:- start:214 stop:675 length:462 start_codon:yes stop_codon:yes gene_type:complete